MTEWVKIQTGNPNFTCIKKDNIKDWGFDTKSTQTFNSCQACSQCSGQSCPSLSQDREFYKLGTLKSIVASVPLSVQPYTFPLPLNQGPTPKINENILTWMRSN